LSRNDLTWDEARERAELISEVRYRVDLDLTEDDGFRSEAVVTFGCATEGADTFIDLTAPELLELTVNGERRNAAEAFDGNRVRLDGLKTDNEVRIVARGAYNRTEVGMHHFVDPADGNVYVHTHLEPFGCHRVFACFDQPDMKGTFDFTVRARGGWEVISNGRVATNDGNVWTFDTTPRIPTYITAVCAGPYRVWRDSHGDIELGLYCRQSLAQFFEPDELFEITKQGFDFFQPAFGHDYAFPTKYDQVFIPESNSGAMENAACVTFNDIYVFRSRMTDAAKERRAETILHEMAHMWFGDLVTMRWWNDLWLNESFASYMAVLSQAEGTRWTDAWTTFADSEKTWALRQDQLPTTHPVVADVPDVESVHLNFDGISYAKGASVLKQLAAWVGRDRFFNGLQDYCERHGFGNATLDDFLAALERASERDLHAWSKEWLETAGVNTLRPRFTTEERDGTEVFASFSVVQEAPEDWPTLRSHRLGIGLYDDGADGGIVRRRYVELDVTGEETDVPDLIGEAVPALTLLNDDDLTFAKIRLDERSLATVVDRLGAVEEPLARALCWTACWDMTRDGEMRARDYLQLVIRNIGREAKVGVVQSLLAQASSAVNLYGDPGNRDAARATLAEAALEGLRGAEAGSDHQLVWARAFFGAAVTDAHHAAIRGLLDGDNPFEGLVVDVDLRWGIVRSLAAAGRAQDELIAAEEASDRTDRGERHAAAARTARPTEEAKAEAWRTIVEEEGLPLALVDEVMAAFQQFGQEDLLEPYASKFFDTMTRVWEEKDLPDALAFGRRMYPFTTITQEIVDATDRYLAQPDVPGPVRRLLLEGKDGILRAMRARKADATEPVAT
jgi:aminopeptidase N